MAEKVFIRVKDKRTKHEFDVHVQAFDPKIYEELKGVPRASAGRPAEPYIEKSSTPKVVEGVSPAGEKLATSAK